MKKIAWIGFLILSLANIAGCDQAPRQRIYPPVVGKFGYERIDLSDHEYVILMTIPSYGLAQHCTLYVNERHANPVMRCDS